MTLEDVRLKWRPVTLGSSSATRTQVTSGLNEGAAVALAVEFPLKDGEQVKAVYP
jgi:hypothetical protein